MRLPELMDSNIFSISENDYATEALRLMRNQGLKWLFVLNREQLAGVVFRSDLERCSDATLKEREVREFLNARIMVVDPGTLPQEAERMLRLSGQDFLAVVKGNCPIGIITSDTLMNMGARRQREAS